MTLTARLSLSGPDTPEPEDLLSSALGVIFPDDVTNQHGDADHGLVYTSPHLPHPLELALAEVKAETDRQLFSHYLWNSSLLLAELIEADTLRLGLGGGQESRRPRVDIDAGAPPPPPPAEPTGFDVAGLATIELGAGTALPSIMAGLLGARRVVVTDYPAPPILKTLRHNVARNIQPRLAPPCRFAAEEVLVEGHEWGEAGLDTPFARGNRHAFDRVLAADCLWMPWQHENLRRSVAWFLGEGEGARAWVVGGFHTGRDRMRGFFDKEALGAVGLEVERIWERDCNGQDREWVWDRGIEDVTVRKRWLAVAVLRRIRKSAGERGGVCQ
jgi:predicted nicotinamide N-methyase